MFSTLSDQIMQSKLNRKRNVAQKTTILSSPYIYTINLAICVMIKFWCSGNLLLLNPLPVMLTLGSSNSAANKDMIQKYGQIGIQLSA